MTFIAGVRRRTIPELWLLLSSASCCRESRLKSGYCRLFSAKHHSLADIIPPTLKRPCTDVTRPGIPLINLISCSSVNTYFPVRNDSHPYFHLLGLK